jgi:recombination protein RecT
MVSQRETTLKSLLLQQKDAIAASLPAHLSGERMAQLMLTECRKNPALLDVSQASLVSAMLQCAQIGLEPGPQAHVYLVPYRNKGQLECQLQVGYRGLLELIGRTGRYHSPDVRAVFDGDVFEYEFGLNEKLIHRPTGKSRQPNKLTHVYIVLRPKDGGPATFDVMTREEVDAIRSRSRAGGSGPWVTDYVSMAMKTVVRRKAKYVPMSVELQQAVTLDEQDEIRDEIEVQAEVQKKAGVVAAKIGLAPPVVTDEGGGKVGVVEKSAMPTQPVTPTKPEPAFVVVKPEPEPDFTENPAPSLALNDNAPGTYVMQFGKNKGKRLDECQMTELEQTESWINNKATHPLTNNMIDFLAALAQYKEFLRSTEDIPF